MNAAHQHLLINHFPIIALILGILVLLIGILSKSSVTRRVGLLLFLIAGITSMVSMSTGEGAEGMMPFMWGIIALSLIALFLEWKKKSMALIASITVLLVGMIATYFARQVGTTGGEISHPEIRKGYKVEHHDDHD